MTQSDYIDGEHIPFTEEEVRRAFELVVSPGEAERVAAEIVELVKTTEEMGREAEAARARGSMDPDEISAPSWCVGDELFALLWCVPEFSARVDKYFARRWEMWERGLLEAALHRRGLRPNSMPPDDALGEVRRATARHRGAWTRRKRAMADRVGVPRPDRSAKDVPGTKDLSRDNRVGSPSEIGG
jgi:hypothetical protein